MPLLSHPAFGPRTAIIYITVGTLIDVWTTVWYFAFARDSTGEMTRNTQFWLLGLFLTGLTLILIGFFLGHIGRAARKAELPPKEAQADETAIQQTAAANPQPVMAGTVAAQTSATPTVNAMPATPAMAQPQAAQQFAPAATRR
jgi:hypothetical protein